MKNRMSYLGVFLLLLGAVSKRALAEDATLHGVGLCAKCALGQSDVCQNAIRVQKDGKEIIYLLTQNELSKAFHKNLCTGTADITAVGLFEESNGKKFFTANKLSLRKEAIIKGEGLCLKCALGLTPNCQNGIRVQEGDDQVLYILEHNEISKAFHKNLCTKTAGVNALGEVGILEGLGGVKRLIAKEISLIQVADSEKSKPQKVKPVAKKITIKGLGMCAKCELGQTTECQNAIRVLAGGKELIYLFSQNELSKAFHKNLCTKTAAIVATGSLKAQDDPSLFVASNIALQEAKTLEGTGLCLKCALGKSRTCQNAIRVSADGKELIYRLDQNAISRKFHKHLCRDSLPVFAEGTIAKIGDRLEYTASKIELK